MKTFEQYLQEDRLEHAAVLLEECNFPLYELTEWYFEEGYCLSEDELRQVMEGFWAEAENTFWGDTWRNAAKGAGIGAGAGAGAGGVLGAGVGGAGALPGAGIGAGIGGLIGGIGGGLYGMGKHLWNRLTQKPEQPAQKPDNAALLKKLSTDHPDLFQALGLNPDELSQRLQQPAQTQTQQQAAPKKDSIDWTKVDWNPKRTKQKPPEPHPPGYETGWDM